jgi:hypothetical protein
MTVSGAYGRGDCPIGRHRSDFASSSANASSWHVSCANDGVSQEDAMIARSVVPFTFRNFLERGRLASMLGFRLGRWKQRLTALGDWSPVPDLAGRSEILLRDRAERFRRFCHDCEEDTAHDGFDELGPGWYAQICRCRRCGRQDMKVWPLTCW